MVFIENFEFTYQDYLNYYDSFYSHEEIEPYISVAEESVEYTYDESSNKTKDKKHDKIFKEILQNPEEMVQFINNFTKYKVEIDELENYTENYITKDFKYKQADIVYKIKDEEIYFLVEHQTKVDYMMSYRILNYCVEIMRSSLDNRKIISSNIKFPKIIPIVIYTGKTKWKASTSFAMSQIEKEGFEDAVIDITYKLIDINKYEIETLLKVKTMLANVMILEKSRNKQEIIDNLTQILENSPKGKPREKLERIVMYLYNNLDNEDKKVIIKLIEESEGEKNMLNVRRILDAEIRKEIIGTVKNIIKNMLQQNEDEEKIMKYTNAKKEDIEIVKKELGMC